MEEQGLKQGPNYTVQVKTEYMCSFCGQMFLSLSEMQFHVDSHSRGNATNCSCHVCGKIYNTPSKLRRHVRTHSGEKPYPCQVCGRCFGRSDHLKQHMKVHLLSSKRQKHLCRLCGMMFLKSDTLVSHLAEHGVRAVHNYSLCGEVFGGQEKPEQHEKCHLKDKVTHHDRPLELKSKHNPSEDNNSNFRLFADHQQRNSSDVKESMLGIARSSSTVSDSDKNNFVLEDNNSSSFMNIEPSFFGLGATSVQTSIPVFPRNTPGENFPTSDKGMYLPTLVIDSSRQSESGESSGKPTSSEDVRGCQEDGSDAALNKGSELIDKCANTRLQSSCQGFRTTCRRKHSIPRKRDHTVWSIEADDSAEDASNEKLLVSNMVGYSVGHDFPTKENSTLGKSLNKVLLREDVSFDSCTFGTVQKGASCAPPSNDLGGESGSETDRPLSNTPGSMTEHFPPSAQASPDRRCLDIGAMKNQCSKQLTFSQFNDKVSFPDLFNAVSSSERVSGGSVEVENSSLTAQRGYRCEPCRIWFEDYSMFLLHRSLHSSGEQSPFCCLSCGKKLGNRLEFTAHLIWHLSPNMGRLEQ